MNTLCEIILIGKHYMVSYLRVGRKLHTTCTLLQHLSSPSAQTMERKPFFPNKQTNKQTNWWRGRTSNKMGSHNTFGGRGRHSHCITVTNELWSQYKTNIHTPNILIILVRNNRSGNIPFQHYDNTFWKRLYTVC